MKTIKELADQLGLPKNRIKYQLAKLIKEDNSLASELITLKDGVQYLDDVLISMLLEKLSIKNSGSLTGELTTINQLITTTLTTDITEVLSKENDFLKKQIEVLNNEKIRLHNLLDQQQKLNLHTQELLKDSQKELESRNLELNNKTWWKFWK